MKMMVATVLGAVTLMNLHHHHHLPLFCEALALSNSNNGQPSSRPATRTPSSGSSSRHDEDLHHQVLEDDGPTTSAASASTHLTMTRRRLAFNLFWAGSTASTMQSASSSAGAFDNKISTKYDDRPKRRGPKPNDLGVSARTNSVDEYNDDGYMGLKGCNVAPNCFSSSLNVVEDPDHSIPSWTSNTASVENTFAQLKAVVEAYPPGQNGVDGGGFAIQSYDPKRGYLYVQFEALKNGYIDDVEFAVIDAPPRPEDQMLTVHVRSSSRIGYLDYGVNAKRLNYLAAALRAKGWDSPGVDLKTHAFYAAENQLL
jgi:uncharacterized protein (DUF1499 family)